MLLGAAVTTAYAMGQCWPATVPAYAWEGGLLATVGVGALAGLHPAVRASHLPPVEALAGA